MAGEEILKDVRLHRATFLIPLTFCILAALLWIVAGISKNPSLSGGGLGMFLVLGMITIRAVLQYFSSTYVVTNRRVLIKVGLLSKKSVETLLTKVESIGIEQPLLGRILDFGTIVIGGTGGTKEAFSNIDQPNEFRMTIQEQIEKNRSR